MYKLNYEKVGILYKTEKKKTQNAMISKSQKSGHFEFHWSNMSQKSWDRALFTIW